MASGAGHIRAEKDRKCVLARSSGGPESRRRQTGRNCSARFCRPVVSIVVTILSQGPILAGVRPDPLNGYGKPAQGAASTPHPRNGYPASKRLYIKLLIAFGAEGDCRSVGACFCPCWLFAREGRRFLIPGMRPAMPRYNNGARTARPPQSSYRGLSCCASPGCHQLSILAAASAAGSIGGHRGHGVRIAAGVMVSNGHLVFRAKAGPSAQLHGSRRTRRL